MTGEQERTAVLDGLALVEAHLGKDREGIGAILVASDDPDHLRTVAEVAAAVAGYAIGELVDHDHQPALFEYLVGCVAGGYRPSKRNEPGAYASNV
jgi:hypothetical protein